MFAQSEVNWSTRSEKDPRFNMDGSCTGLSGAAFIMDREIRKKAAELGIEPPDDIQVEAWKD